MTRRTKGLEVHEHCIITGPKANQGARIVHAHAQGDVPHQHPDTGPAAYTIDKDDWFRSTGLRGGGRKRFTATPTGAPLAFVERDAAQQSFEIFVGTPPADYKGAGPGLAPAARMILGMGMTVSAVRRAQP